MTLVYVVKSSKTEDVDGMELDPIRFVTLEESKALAFVNDNPDEFLWVDGYELDGTTVTHVL